MKKNTGRLSFADSAIMHRRINTDFFDRINAIIDWDTISSVIDNYDQRGKGIAGNSAYPGIVLFKMSLLQIWYGLSDREAEARVCDSISFSRFCGLSMSDPVPDHSILCRFRNQMTQSGAWDVLFEEINKQLEAGGLLVKTGTIVDASITQTPLKPKGKTRYEIREQTDPESGEENQLLAKVYPEKVDKEAAWTKKAGKIYYGYKKHHGTDMNGLILAVETTAANVHDNQVFEHLIEQIAPAKGTPVLADKGYCGKKRDQYLASKRLINGIQKKAGRGKELSAYHKHKNKAISKVRYIVERTFGGQKRWFGAGLARYRGLAKTHTQHVMEAIAYNLKRAPGLAMKIPNQPAFMG